MTVYCLPPLLVAPCRSAGQCWGHDGCVGFADCPCIRCRNTRMHAHETRETARDRAACGCGDAFGHCARFQLGEHR